MPLPPARRVDLTVALQALWGAVEEVVAQRPPSAPERRSREAVERWANGAFAIWLDERKRSIDAVNLQAQPLIEAHAGLKPEQAHAEQGMAAALLGYLYEDTASALRGAPIEETVAKDKALLAAYETKLLELVQPLVTDAARAYKVCVERFRPYIAVARSATPDAERAPDTERVADPVLAEWAYYCDQRGREVIEVYNLSP